MRLTRRTVKLCAQAASRPRFTVRRDGPFSEYLTVAGSFNTKLIFTRLPVRLLLKRLTESTTVSVPTWMTPFMKSLCGVQMYW